MSCGDFNNYPQKLSDIYSPCLYMFYGSQVLKQSLKDRNIYIYMQIYTLGLMYFKM